MCIFPMLINLMQIIVHFIILLSFLRFSSLSIFFFYNSEEKGIPRSYKVLEASLK